ncbi:MAG TPA: hypothetical protein VEL31_10535 [Ktedonobacteraceae bacterium]|nr:hypothetical protein [Ktedonobacteraceae bacterium]
MRCSASEVYLARHMLELAATNELKWLADLFLFTALPENMDALEPRQLFLDPVWFVPSEDENPVSLLGE